MPLYTQQPARFGSHVGTVRDTRDNVREYRAARTNQRKSVYSPHIVIVLRRRHGNCAGCRFERDLVNDYCDTCRACGANESQCLNPKRIEK